MGVRSEPFMFLCGEMRASRPTNMIYVLHALQRRRAHNVRPYGKNYIAHDDIPPEVQAAFERLQAVYGTQTRAANPLYASK